MFDVISCWNHFFKYIDQKQYDTVWRLFSFQIICTRNYNNQIVCDSFINTNKINLETQAAFTSSKSIMETHEQYVEIEQS